MTTLMTFDLQGIYEFVSKFILCLVVAHILDLIVILLFLQICKLSNMYCPEEKQSNLFRTFIFWGTIIGLLGQIQ